MLKKERGITLVALVVTIIVLLILAGITISLTVSQQGLFQRAKNASNTYRNAATNEQSALNEAESELANTLNEFGLND